jgi:GNAT superfamily N-acetyltransferase
MKVMLRRVKYPNILQSTFLDDTENDIDAEKGVEYIFAQVGNNIAGAIVIKEDGFIPSVFVTEKYRQLGIMRKMMYHALRKNEKLTWVTTLEAMPAYLNIGAKNIGLARMILRREK